MPPEQVARHQRARLRAAMVEAVSRHGYAGTTLRELVRLAGVSKSTFYEHYGGKQDAFLATSDAIVAEINERVSAAHRDGGEDDPRLRLTRALSAYLELVAEEPDAATLTTVETLTLGKAGIEHRDRGSKVIEETLQQTFADAPSAEEVDSTTVRAIAAGIRGIVYRHLRSGTAAELPGLTEEIAEWALGYGTPPGDAVRRATKAASDPSADVEEPDTVDWSEPPDSPRSRSELSQRERIVRAVGQIVVESGYETLSIPSISARSGTSNQTFYEHFDSKRDAFLAAFDISAAKALARTVAAFEAAPEGPEAIGAGLRALLDHVAGNELFARLAFFDLQTAGPVALDRADSVMASFSALLTPAKGEGRAEPATSAAILEAIASASWAVIQHELVANERRSLGELAPELVRIVVAPLYSD